MIDLDLPECPHGFPDRTLPSGKHRCPWCRTTQERQAAQAMAWQRIAQDPTTPDPAALAANDHTPA
jgi:hypothetical protein